MAMARHTALERPTHLDAADDVGLLGLDPAPLDDRHVQLPHGDRAFDDDPQSTEEYIS